MPERLSNLTEQEKAYFDTIKDVSKGPRPRDLQLWRMTLDGREVAVMAQRVIGPDAREVGFQPLALILDDETAARLRGPDGSPAQSISPEGLEGSA